jgi:colicin import membrane protein
MQESSIVFSLKELRAIEDQRIADEHQARERSRQAEVAARAAAERAVREAEEARLAAVREEHLRAERAKVEAERDLRLRVETAEAAERARVTAVLDAERLREEMALRRAEVLRKRPRWMIAVTVMAGVAAVALSVFAIDRMHQADAATEATAVANLERDQAKARAKEAGDHLDQMRKDLDVLDSRVTGLADSLSRAQTEADRAKLRTELAEARKQKLEEQKRIDDWNAAQAKKERDKVIDVKACAQGTLDCIRGH